MEQLISLLEFRYVRELLRCGQITEAIRCSGVVPGARSWIGKTRETSTKPYLWDLYMETQKKAICELDITAKRIKEEYARIAFFDPLDMFNDDGSFKALSEMPEDARRVISGMEIVTNRDLERILKLKISDKRGALDSLARVMGMNQDNVKVTHSYSEMLDEITHGAMAEPLVKDDE